MALLFISWAAFQYDDPDPFLWILVYGLAALASVLFLIKRLPLAYPLIFSAVGIGWALYLSAIVIYDAPLLGIEEWREMMGLVTISVWMAILAWLLRREKKAEAQNVS